MRTTAAIALVLIALAAMPAAAETWLLGGVLASAAAENDESGLIDLFDVQGSVYGVEVPYETDLVVYLRWEGAGKHAVDLYLLDPRGGEVTHLSEPIDLGDDGTNYTTHALSGIVLREEGTYLVAVRVDGEDLLDLPYYVNDDTGAPEEPYLLMSLTAVDGWLDELGWGQVEGTFEHYTFERFPDSDDFAIVTFWFSGDATFEQRIEIRDPAGAVVGRPSVQEFEAWFGELTVVTDYFEDFPFSVPGDYLVTVYLDDEEYLSYTLRAVAEK